MANSKHAIEAHYSRNDLDKTILDALQNAGKDLNSLTPADLAPIDEFHIRGPQATFELARLAELSMDYHVLDVGCGLGGPSRHLVTAFGCRVTGLDITAEYCRVAAMLTERMGLGAHIDYRHGDALAMPFDDGCFDQVWMQHTSMNIADKLKLFAEIHRVLKPTGRLAVYEIVAGAAGSPYFPVPWAREPSISFLISADEMRGKLVASGFRVLSWHDATKTALEWFHKFMRRSQGDKRPKLGLHLLFGADWSIIGTNQIKNLEENRIALVQAVLEPLRPRHAPDNHWPE